MEGLFKLDHYVVKRELGRGGQGIVYLAHDEDLQIDVALKRLLPEYRTLEVIERFKTDARVLARLDHPNIVRVSALKPEKHYLVLEYCEGGDLKRLLVRRQRLSLRRIVSIARDVCDALAHAHDAGVLHRDIKPHNVLFKKDVPKVADFGLAKLLSGQTSHTKSRSMMGTFLYCSPEQARDAARVDARTDLWPVGVMLYETLTWRHPFARTGMDERNIFVAVSTAPPFDPPYEVPAPLMEVVKTALQKDPDRRFASAREMMRALDAALVACERPDEMLLPPEELVGDLEHRAAELMEMLDESCLDEAGHLLGDLKRSYPGDSLIRDLGEELKRVRRESSPVHGTTTVTSTSGGSGIEVARIISHIEEGQFDHARALIGQALTSHPSNSALTRLLQQLKEQEDRCSEDLSAAQDKASAARVGGDLGAALQVWEEIAGTYPKHPYVRNMLLVARAELDLERRRKDWQKASDEAQRCRAAGELQGALSALKNFLQQYPDDLDAADQVRVLEREVAQLESAERVAGLRNRALRKEASEDWEAALAAWQDVLGEAPDDEEARRRGRELEQRIRQNKLRERLELVRAQAGQLEKAGDFTAAIPLWEALAEEYADVEEALSEVGRLRTKQMEGRRERFRSRLASLREDLEGRLTNGRYRSLAEAQETVRKSLQRAELPDDSDPRVLGEAVDLLASVRGGAEKQLTTELSAWRSELRGRWNAGTETVGDSDLPARPAVGAALRSALEALSAADDGRMDPLEPLATADRVLREALDSLQRERREAVDGVQANCHAALEECAKILRSIEDDRGPGPSKIQAETLTKEHRRLRELAGSADPTRLLEVERGARALVSRARADQAVSEWKLTTELRQLVLTAFALLPEVRDESLEALVGRASQLLEADVVIAGERCTELQACRDALQQSLNAVQGEANNRIKQARERWASVLAEWEKMLLRDLGSSARAEGEDVQAAARAALNARRPIELESLASQLEGLIRRYRVEAVWIEFEEAVFALEGPADREGLPLAKVDPDLQNQLALFRERLSEGNWEEASKLGQELQRRKETVDAAGSWRPGDFVELTKRARRLNERHQPAELERYDQILGKHERALAAGHRAEANRIETELGQASRRLLEPQPVWRRWSLVAAALVVAVVAGYLGWPERQEKVTTEVTVLALGERRPLLYRQGAERVGPPLSDDGRGVYSWALEHGRYELKDEVGDVLGSFEVPGQTRVLLPVPSEEMSSGLREMLNASVD